MEIDETNMVWYVKRGDDDKQENESENDKFT